MLPHHVLCVIAAALCCCTSLCVAAAPITSGGKVVTKTAYLKGLPGLMCTDGLLWVMESSGGKQRAAVSVTPASSVVLNTNKQEALKAFEGCKNAAKEPLTNLLNSLELVACIASKEAEKSRKVAEQTEMVSKDMKAVRETMETKSSEGDKLGLVKVIREASAEAEIAAAWAKDAASQAEIEANFTACMRDYVREEESKNPPVPTAPSKVSSQEVIDTVLLSLKMTREEVKTTEKDKLIAMTAKQKAMEAFKQLPDHAELLKKLPAGTRLEGETEPLSAGGPRGDGQLETVERATSTDRSTDSEDSLHPRPDLEKVDRAAVNYTGSSSPESEKTKDVSTNTATPAPTQPPAAPGTEGMNSETKDHTLSETRMTTEAKDIDAAANNERSEGDDTAVSAIPNAQTEELPSVVQAKVRGSVFVSQGLIDGQFDSSSIPAADYARQLLLLLLGGIALLVVC
ncbi:hypothetical protein DQ04_09861010 [Trypanosoma grayi]|uniref:hypothetical protein n=1 Tax=Trypanosoma grayi TaxID=71804 RepID=UPI0004F40E9A|nr:hypothetical protein DQ04_09861010 [Trypanosoma grayi]KEG07422.1 hypothetical protein DQ04_09861010 [Trypanosoma grayi]